MLKLTKILLSTSVLFIAPTLANDNEQQNSDIAGLPQALLGNFAPYSKSSSKDSKVATIEQISEKKANGNFGIIQPPKDVVDGTDFYASGDFLYWQSHQQGLEYAITSENPTTVTPFQMQNGKLRDVSQGWTEGFRLGVGYRFKYDFWDLNLTWTRLNQSQSDSVRAPTGGSLTPAWWLFSASGVEALRAKNKTKLHYQTLDFQLSRSYFVSRKLALTPSLGVRGAQIHDHFKNVYSGGSFVPPLGKQIQEGTSNLWSVGPRAGFGANFCFNSEWSIFGKASGSLEYGKYHVTMKGKFEGLSTVIVAVPQHQATDVQRNYYRLKSNIDLAVGFAWGIYFNETRGHFNLVAAYEFISWFHQNQFIDFAGGGRYNGGYIQHSGNLTFQGLTLSARLDF